MERLGLFLTALVAVFLFSGSLSQEEAQGAGLPTLYGTFPGGGVVEVQMDLETPEVSLVAFVSRPSEGQLAICWTDEFGRGCFAPPNGKFGKDNCVKFSKSPFAIPSNARVEVVDEHLQTVQSAVLSSKVPRSVHKIDHCR